MKETSLEDALRVLGKGRSVNIWSDRESFMKGHVAIVTVVKKGSSSGSVPASPVAALRSRNVTSRVCKGRAWAPGSGA